MSESLSPLSNDNLALLTSVPHELEAGMIVAALEQEGIRSCMTGIHSAGFRADAPGDVKVYVFEDDLPRAVELLADIQSANAEPIDWSQVDVGDPTEEE